jgi:hypothetical protein
MPCAVAYGAWARRHEHGWLSSREVSGHLPRARSGGVAGYAASAHGARFAVRGSRFALAVSARGPRRHQLPIGNTPSQASAQFNQTPCLNRIAYGSVVPAPIRIKRPFSRKPAAVEGPPSRLSACSQPCASRNKARSCKLAPT